ncbi:hypothetical protein NEUTE1DRAFT_101306 [Neurospora tetrasperma FGSC 2508]|uniref:Uncharacterized protein n=1 Tax=Neurospora tetrasperma (strain FGSC 2508 / ATCC MYA-4615 / P0657) TaxID=510951 RepID=F8MLW8_NEUT8|nr:uncharacterized protein NEUTE1DRAFT_101306 [Neurospora tetrasperma FGSC 2508]EGO58483.1 hypothetical protein NEUTE1DRAFT_101306 [Neurospora tetrasperma FGSC 2508]EGZ71180.1 hypothetical protein NEUTE2DRAFT_66710 [Neurospora tetrasperma FGSC 2509]
MRDCDPFSHCHPVSEGSYVIDQNQNQRQRLSREKRGQGGIATRTSSEREMVTAVGDAGDSAVMPCNSSISGVYSSQRVKGGVIVSPYKPGLEP